MASALTRASGQNVVEQRVDHLQRLVVVFVLDDLDLRGPV
jgi:hypothetical protein